MSTFCGCLLFLSFEKLYNKSYFKNTFPPRGSAKRASTLCSRSASSVEAGRRSRKRSIRGVCEHSENKPDAKRALSDDFYFINTK